MRWRHVVFSVVLVVSGFAALPAVELASAQANAPARAEFEAFYEKVSQAQAELFRGRAEPLKAVWSRASDATLFAAYGGTDERGWDKVEPRLDWASKQYAEGSVTVARIASYLDGSVGHVVQTERIRFKIPGHAEESLLELRATWIFRRERDGWRVLHRHADRQITRQGPTEGNK
jgi:ketosteroid isomerase-like protein